MSKVLTDQEVKDILKRLKEMERILGKDPEEETPKKHDSKETLQ